MLIWFILLKYKSNSHKNIFSYINYLIVEGHRRWEKPGFLNMILYYWILYNETCCN